jgi:hypothetical protein
MKEKSCRVQLYTFLKQAYKNKWIYDDKMKVYIRKGYHCINNNLFKTLDIASIEVFITGNGIGTSFIDIAHAINPFEATYIESVLNERFLKHLLKDNWILQENSIPPSVYKLKETICCQELEVLN